MKQLSLALVLVLIVSLFAGTALADWTPSQPITIMNHVAVGGAMDLYSRKLFLGGSSFRRMEIPEGIPERIIPWYTRKEMFIGKYTKKAYNLRLYNLAVNIFYKFTIVSYEI